MPLKLTMNGWPFPLALSQSPGIWTIDTDQCSWKTAKQLQAMTQLHNYLFLVCWSFANCQKFLLILRNLCQQSSFWLKPTATTDALQEKSQPKSNCHSRKMSLHWDRWSAICRYICTSLQQMFPFINGIMMHAKHNRHFKACRALMHYQTWKLAKKRHIKHTCIDWYRSHIHTILTVLVSICTEDTLKKFDCTCINWYSWY